MREQEHSRIALRAAVSAEQGMAGLPVPVCTSATGTAAEMLISAHFLQRGFYVFRALTHTCPVDLVVWRPGEAPLKVEVKYGGEPKRETYNVALQRPTNNEWDLLAVAVYDGRVVVLKNDRDWPELVEQFRTALQSVGVIRKVKFHRSANKGVS